MRTVTLWVVVASFGCGLSRSAVAAEAGTDEGADTLFRDGLTLFDAKQYAQACPKLAESFRLEPATGSLLALAACHEAEGKTASAWLEYGTVVDRAREEGREDRVQAARQHRATLEPRLAKLTIALPAEIARIPGLAVTRDGEPVKAESFGTAAPVDPGDHSVEASAPGRQSWSTTITLQGDGATGSVTVSSLAELPTQGWPQSNDPDRSRASLRVAGIATSLTGLFALGIGGYLTWQAIRQNHDSESDCAGNACGPAGMQARLSAISSARGATIATVVGGALVVGGVALYILARPREPGPTLALAPAVDARSAGVALTGVF